MPHTDGGFGFTPNVIVQTSAKVTMVSRFLGLVGSLPLDENTFLTRNTFGFQINWWTIQIRGPHLTCFTSKENM